MGRNRLFPIILFFVVLLLFFYGVGELLVMRFETGDVYPPYSSYRSDPQGTRALLEGLGLVRGLSAARNTTSLTRLSGIDRSTLFLVGLDGKAFSRMDLSSVEAMEDGARKGGRIVIAFGPMRNEDRDRRPSSAKEAAKEDGKGKEGGEAEETPTEEYADLYDRWQVGTRFLAQPQGTAVLKGGLQGLPSSIDWHTAMVFDPHYGDWRTVYEREGNPVLMERSFGKGEIVLASDAFFLSNEAMKGDRHADLLSYLCGNHRRIIFDETHLGISESLGIAGLIERHGLAPFFASLIVLILLALWRAHAAFVPAPEGRVGHENGAGKDYSIGLANLIRGNIGPDAILAVCVDEWEGSFTHTGRNLSALLPRMREIVQEDLGLPRRMRNPVDAYRRIGRLIRPRGIERSAKEADDRSPAEPILSHALRSLSLRPICGRWAPRTGP
jgi:hypothetical protein